MLLVALTPVAAKEPEVPSDWPAVKEETFLAVWETVNESYYDPNFNGVDWAAMKEKYRGRLPQAADPPALRGLLENMLGELHSSHFAVLPRETAVFSPVERKRIGTVGAQLVFVDQVVAVGAVDAGSAAARAGLRPGDAIVRVDQLDLAGLEGMLEKAGMSPARRGFYLTLLVNGRLQAAEGTQVDLAVRGRSGAERNVSVVCEEYQGPWSDPVGSFPSEPISWTVRHEANGLSYVSFNVFARQVMKPVRAALRSTPPDGGLVLDLRGNPGGISLMASGLSGWLCDHELSLGTMHLREGHIDFMVTPQAGAFLGPVAVLVDCGSASTSEILAAGLQEAGRTRVFGEPTPGAALPSQFKALPTGDILQYAVADLQTPRGVLIEGHGVIPDEVVQRSRADLAAGRDPVLEAAERWLESRRDGPVDPAAVGL